MRGNEKAQLSPMELLVGVLFIGAGLYLVARWLSASLGADVALALYALALAIIVVAMMVTRRM